VRRAGLRSLFALFTPVSDIVLKSKIRLPKEKQKMLDNLINELSPLENVFALVPGGFSAAGKATANLTESICLFTH